MVKLGVKAGQTVATGTSLATVADTSALYLEILADQEDLPKLSKGRSAQVVLDALPRETVRAKIEEIGSMPVTGTIGLSGYPVKLVLETPPKGTRLGMTGQAEMVTEQLVNVLFVPKRSVLERRGEVYVFPVEAERVTKTLVNIGEKPGIITRSRAA